MYAALLPAIATCLAATLIATLILARRERSPIHRTSLALLCAIMAWTAGVVWRFTHSDDAGVWQGLALINVGIHSVAPIWLMLAARYTRSRWAEESRWLHVGVWIPPVVAYLAFVTNDHHGLYATEISHAALVAGPRSWGGPVFWMNLAWTYALAIVGTSMLLAHAWRLRGTRERRYGVQLAAAALAPVLFSQIYIFRILPVPYDLTPTGLCITVLILYSVLARERIFETLPLARRDVIEDLPDGVVLADSDGVVLDANPAACAILGRSPRSLAGLSLRSALADAAVPEARAELERRIERAFEEAAPASHRFETGGGRRIDLSVAPVTGERGRPAGIYALLRDCTEQHRYEQVVRQTQKLESVGFLAAGVAHEVNNPLAFIQANLGTLQQMADAVERNLSRLPEKDARELADLREVLDDSLEGIARISRIVNRLRRFSRAPDDETGPVEPSAVVEEAIRFARLDRKGDWTLSANLSPGLPAVRASRDGLTQVLLNLLLNAIQAVAGRADGQVAVEGRRDGDKVVLEVRDNGPGVSADVRQHIFDPFFTTKPPGQGTGLGLAIAYDIVRDHEGELELRSGPEPGACFRLVLPVASI